MGVFDIFGKKDKREQAGVSFDEEKRTSGGERQAKGNVAVFFPQGYGDIEKIIDNMKAGKEVLVHLEHLKPSTAIRVLDLLSGAIYALNGGLTELQKDLYFFTPNGIDMN